MSFFCKKAFFAFLFILLTAIFGSFSIAETNDIFTYTISEGCVTITDCSAVTGSVTVPEEIDGCPVTVIGSYAFIECRGITEISLPYNLITIESYAFSNCDALEIIHYPATYNVWKYKVELKKDTGLDTSCIRYSDTTTGSCGEDIAWTLSDSGKLTISGSGAMDSNAGQSPWTCQYRYVEPAWTETGYRVNPSTGQVTQYEIYHPEEYIVEDKCFVKEVVISDGITSIGDYAFFDCTTLTSVSLGNDVSSIGSYAFAGCENIASVTMPDSLKTVGSYAFAGCGNIASVTMPESLKTIGSYAFENCVGLNSISAGKSLLSIGEYAFQNCTALSNLEMGESLLSIGDYAFNNCTALTTVTIPDTCQAIGDYAFLACANLSEINLPAACRSIGHWAFSNCGMLTEIFIPDACESIGYGAFSGCSSLTSVTGMAGLKAIDDYAFDGCSAIAEFHLPDTITTLGKYAFEGCKAKLYCNDYTSDTVRALGISGYSFVAGIYELKPQVSGNVITGYIMTKYNGTEEELTLPEMITGIENFAFSGNKTVKCLILHDNVNYIGKNALMSSIIEKHITKPGTATAAALSTTRYSEYYYGDYILWATSSKGIYDEVAVYSGCSVADYIGSDTDLILPEGIKSVAISFLNGNTSVTSVVIPKTVSRIDSSAFKNCVNLESVSLPSSLTTIEHDAFSGCTKLKSITIPKSVSSISSRAFKDCVLLEEIVITNPNASLGNYAFTGCTGLTRFVYPYSTHKFEGTALDGCTNLEWIADIFAGKLTIKTCNLSGSAIEIPDKIGGYTVTALDSNLFAGNTTLTSVQIPDTVTVIKDGVFDGCTALENITLPEALTEIGSNAFRNCASMPGISFGNALKNIGVSSFSGCESLTEIILPDGVEKIGDNAFAGCNAVRNIRIPDNCTVGSNAFPVLLLLSADSCTLFAGDVVAPGVFTTYATEVILTSDNPDVVLIENGCLRALSAGTAVISAASDEYPVMSDSITVTVKEDALTLALPDNLIRISEEAFRGIRAQRIILPAIVQTVSTRAFSESPALCQIIVPGETELSPSSMEGSENVVLICHADSAAQAFAKANDIPYLLIP